MGHKMSRFKLRILTNLFIALFESAMITITLWIIFSYLGLYRLIPNVNKAFLMGCIYFVLLFIIFGKLLDMSFSYINKMVHTINEISKGNFDVAIPIEQDDELGYIAHHINNMARQLRMAKVRDQHSLEKERLANLTLLEEENSKHDLITNVAHDLRTPLTSMIGYLQLLWEKTDLDEKTKRKYLKIAYDKSLRLNSLLDDLFNYASFSSGHVTLQKNRINISELVAQLADEFYPVFEKHQLSLKMDISNPVIYVDGDGNLLARVFDNLISNAIKYNQGGDVITIQITDDLKSVTIKVINDGPEIDREELDHLFEKFYRTDKSRQSKNGGTGLGLAIAKSIIEMHEGEIFATSRHHKTSFIVVLKKYGT